MWNLLWPMLMVVGANTVYNICAKSVPDKLNSFAALTINYLVAAGLSLALFYLTSGGGKSLVQEMAKTNWAPVVMGLTVVGLELGYIFIYRAGGECGLPGGQHRPGLPPGGGGGPAVQGGPHPSPGGGDGPVRGGPAAHQPVTESAARYLRGSLGQRAAFVWVIS